jgi:hypothetical protein
VIHNAAGSRLWTTSASPAKATAVGVPRPALNALQWVALWARASRTTRFGSVPLPADTTAMCSRSGESATSTGSTCGKFVRRSVVPSGPRNERALTTMPADTNDWTGKSEKRPASAAGPAMGLVASRSSEEPPQPYPPVAFASTKASVCH